MLNWLYTRAKKFKEYTFPLAGAAVAVSTACSPPFPTISWAANLAALTMGGGIYSALKNMETAESIFTCQEKISKIAMDLSLEKYQSKTNSASFAQDYKKPNKGKEEIEKSNDTSEEMTSSMEITEKPKSLEEILKKINMPKMNVAETIGKIDVVKSNVKKAIPESKWYGNINLFAQMVLSIAPVFFNIMANTEKSDEKNNVWATKNMLNIIFVPLCLVIQYSLHTMYIAKNLRQMANNSEQFKSTLSDAKNSSFFKALECQMFFQHKAEVKKMLQELNNQIESSKAKLHILEIDIKSVENILATAADETLIQEKELKKQSLETQYSELQIIYQKQLNEHEKLNTEFKCLRKDRPRFKQITDSLTNLSGLINQQLLVK